MGKPVPIKSLRCFVFQVIIWSLRETTASFILSHPNPVAFHCAGWINVPDVLYVQNGKLSIRRMVHPNLKVPSGIILPVKSITIVCCNNSFAGNAKQLHLYNRFSLPLFPECPRSQCFRHKIGYMVRSPDQPPRSASFNITCKLEVTHYRVWRPAKFLHRKFRCNP